jgi:hypothetical protein
MNYINCLDTIKTVLHFIKNEQGGMYLRFGDGDFNLAENKYDLLARPNVVLREKMLESMSIRDNRIKICIPHHCKDLNTLEDGMYPGNHEYPYDYIVHYLNILKSKKKSLPDKIYTNVALAYCSFKNPDLVIELHKTIKNYKVLYIGNYQYSDEFLKKLFGKKFNRINTNWRDAFDQYEFVFNELDNYFKNKISNEYFVIVIAAGCSSRAFAYDIYDKYFIKNPNFYLFDYGSLLDYLYGMNTRAYMDLMPPKKEYILENI